MAAHPKYNPDYHDDWAWSLANRGAIDKEIAEAFGVSVRTINRWKKEHPSFERALQMGKGAADSKVEKSLYERAVGSYYEETEVIQELGKDGELKPGKVRKIKRRALPDTMACMYWLNNRQPQNYRRNPEDFYSTEDKDAEASQVQFYLPEKEDEGGTKE